MTVAIRNQQRSVRVDLKRLQKETEFLIKFLKLDNVEVSVLLANDHRIRRLNSEYRGKNSTTDVLSFPMDDVDSLRAAPGEALLGDIVINVHLSRRRSVKERTSLHDVLRVLLVHGLVHLAGYDHERGPAGEKKMKRKERQLLHALSKMDQQRQ